MTLLRQLNSARRLCSWQPSRPSRKQNRRLVAFGTWAAVLLCWCFVHQQPGIFYVRKSHDDKNKTNEKGSAAINIAQVKRDLLHVVLDHISRYAKQTAVHDPKKAASTPSLALKNASPALQRTMPNADVAGIHKFRTLTKFMVWHRKRTYETENRFKLWEQQGLGYAWTQHQLSLSGVLPTNMVPGRTHVTHIIPATDGRRTDCAHWLLWVRVQGPTYASSGFASAVDATGEQSCYWEYAMDIKDEVGDYRIDTKVLLYRKEISLNESDGRCDRQERVDVTESSLKDGIIRETLEPACCELCIKTPGCRNHFLEEHDNCKLIFGDGLADATIALSINPVHNIEPVANDGRVLEHDTMESLSIQHPILHFVGCGWTAWANSDSTCSDPSIDDAVPFFPDNKFVVK